MPSCAHSPQVTALLAIPFRSLRAIKRLGANNSAPSLYRTLEFLTNTVLNLQASMGYSKDEEAVVGVLKAYEVQRLT